MIVQSYQRRSAFALIVTLEFLTVGCIKTESIQQRAPFEQQGLDACLTYVIDQSASFSNIWEEGGWELFLEISEQFFRESVGDETKIVLAQLSGDGNQVVLFEGRPADLKQRFNGPSELKAFIEDQAEPGGSNVYDAARAATDYVLSMPDLTETTRLMTVVFSDAIDTESDPAKRSRSGRRMVDSLTLFRERGGAFAMYFVAPDETWRWRRIREEAGFEKGRFIVQSTLVENPVLPNFN